MKSLGYAPCILFVLFALNVDLTLPKKENVTWGTIRFQNYICLLIS